ncbi:MAG: hypothetical protein O9340_12690 [Cyclobacteriaceae bacterium]|jgi:hypothetical protein|nr:hypothetical protein [Cyclobacteriaceae bacterium]
MLRLSFLLSLFFLFSNSYAQNDLEWNESYKLSLSDFKSPSQEIGNLNQYTLFSAISLEFKYLMSSYEFMATKNFNDKIISVMKRDAAYLIAPDTLFAHQLIAFTQFEFDFAELCARKIRKKIYEEKKAFSNANLLQQVYDGYYQEFVNKLSLYAKQCDLGRKKELLESLHKEILVELNQYKEFCKTCKPTKNRK